MAEWRYLFNPLQIGKITVRNRILSTAHITGFTEVGDCVSPRMVLEAIHERYLVG